MIQTHLMKLDAPYPVLNMKGVLARHVATLIEIHPAVDPKTGQETIKTVSHPVVDYGENNYAGIVYEKLELEDCEILTSPLPMHQLHSIIHSNLSMFNHKLFNECPEFIIWRIHHLGLTIDWPKKKDSEGFETDEDEDHIVVPISMGKAESGWWAESSALSFCFDAKEMESDKALLNYIRNMRSEYYHAFKNRKFDITFQNNQPEVQYLIDELNKNPHL